MQKLNVPGAYTRSGGPKSETGKSVTALNAFRSGAYANLQLLPNESPKDYDAFQCALLDDLNPETELLKALAQSIVDLVWRMKRLDYFESSVLQIEYDQPISTNALISVLDDRYECVVAAVFRMTDEMLNQGVDYFKVTQDKLLELGRVYPGGYPELSVLVNRYSEVYSIFKVISGRGEGLDRLIQDEPMRSMHLPAWHELLEKTNAWLSLRITDFGLLAEYEQAKAKIRNQRIFKNLVNDCAGRPRNDLTRLLQRALAQYHGERERLRKERVIEISSCDDLSDRQDVKDIALME